VFAFALFKKMNDISTLPREVQRQILQCLGTRALACLGLTSKTSEIAKAALALLVERQADATRWCADSLQEIDALKHAILEAVWTGSDFKPEITPRDNVLPEEDTIQVFEDTIMEVAKRFPRLEVRLRKEREETGDGTRYSWQELKVAMLSRLPSPVPNSASSVALEVTLLFRRGSLILGIAWARPWIEVHLLTPTLDVSWIDPRNAMDTSVADGHESMFLTRLATTREGSRMESEFLQDPLALLGACWDDGVVAVCEQCLASPKMYSFICKFF
jgi:hypothetical protein